VKIEILYFEGCPNHRAVEDLVQDVLSELGHTAELKRTAIPDEVTAAAMRFLGSPTIRIDGIDLEPDSDTGRYGLQCRVYSTPSGLSGIPPREVLRARIQVGHP